MHRTDLNAEDAEIAERQAAKTFMATKRRKKDLSGRRKTAERI